MKKPRKNGAFSLALSKCHGFRLAQREPYWRTIGATPDGPNTSAPVTGVSSPTGVVTSCPKGGFLQRTVERNLALRNLVETTWGSSSSHSPWERR
jgi:hypothetical protein